MSKRFKEEEEKFIEDQRKRRQFGKYDPITSTVILPSGDMYYVTDNGQYIKTKDTRYEEKMLGRISKKIRKHKSGKFI